MIWVTLVLSMIAGYLVFWSGVVSLIGFGGWKSLASMYPADELPEDQGVYLKWQSANLGASNYNGVLKSVVAEDGFYLHPVRMFAFNHPPVFIPWSAIVDYKKTFWGGVKLELEGGKYLTLRGKIARYVKDAIETYQDVLSDPLLDISNESFVETETTSTKRVRSRV